MTPRRITYDWHGGEGVGPVAGDVLRTSRSYYQILESRLVVRQSRLAAGERFSLVVVRVDAYTAGAGSRVFDLRWYPRGSRKRSSGDKRTFGDGRPSPR